MVEDASRRRQALAEREAVTDPALAVSHSSADGAQGTGPVSYTSISEADKRHLLVKDEMAKSGAFGLRTITDKDVDIIQRQAEGIALADRDHLVFEKVYSTDFPHWEGAEDLLARQMATLKEYKNMQMMDAKIMMQGFRGTTPQEWDRVFSLTRGEKAIPKAGIHKLASERKSLQSLSKAE